MIIRQSALVTESRSRLPARRASGRGFTLIELMVVVGIAAVLTMIAVPSLVDMMGRNRASGEINTFVADLQYARSEAIKRGQTVSICASSNATTANPPSCLGTNTWQSGWFVFQDVNGNGVYDNSVDTLVRARPGWSGSDTLTTSTGVAAITFGRVGFASNIGGSSVKVTLTTVPANANATRCTTINLAGRQISGC